MARFHEATAAALRLPAGCSITMVSLVSDWMESNGHQPRQQPLWSIAGSMEEADIVSAATRGTPSLASGVKTSVFRRAQGKTVPGSLRLVGSSFA